jgi:predicted aspartyl protease
MKKKENSVKIILGQFDEGGVHIFLNLLVNGKKCRFLVDTGASKSVIDKKYFEDNFGKRNLKTIKQETTGLHSSTSESYYGKIKAIEIGQQKVSNYNIAAVDLSHVNTVYSKSKKPKISGILGSDLMLKYKMILNYGDLKILLP